MVLPFKNLILKFEEGLSCCYLIVKRVTNSNYIRWRKVFLPDNVFLLKIGNFVPENDNVAEVSTLLLTKLSIHLYAHK